MLRLFNPSSKHQIVDLDSLECSLEAKTPAKDSAHSQREFFLILFFLQNQHVPLATEQEISIFGEGKEFKRI